MSKEAPTVLLEYIGPPDQEWYGSGTLVKLVAGRRYPVEATLAAYMVEHDTGHWKRPEPPKPAAAKE